jgi:hypothetical protein
VRLSIEDLNAFGKGRLEDDYAAVSRRDGGKTSRIDFALGWMAAMARHRLWAYFTTEARERLEQPSSVVVMKE